MTAQHTEGDRERAAHAAVSMAESEGRRVRAQTATWAIVSVGPRWRSRRMTKTAHAPSTRETVGGVEWQGRGGGERTR